MKLDQFLAVYANSRNPEPDRRTPVDETGILSDLPHGDTLASHWGDLLYNFLERGSRPDFNEYRRFVDHDYSAWADRSFGHISDTVSYITDALNPETASRPTEGNILDTELLATRLRAMTVLLSKTRFHLLQRFAQGAWMPALYPERFRHSSPDFFTNLAFRARASLGRQAVDIAELRETAHILEARGSDHARDLRRTINGVLAELDAGVVLCEAIRRWPTDRIAAFPAPPMFEQDAGASNVDFLLVDLCNRNALGVQVKSTTLGARPRRSDARRVTLLYAAEDLDGIQLVQARDRDIPARVPWPGSLALRYLSTARYNDVLFSHLTRSRFELYKKRATALLPTTMPAASRQLIELAELTIRTRRATAVRPARSPSNKELHRRQKERERARFDHTVDRVYTRLLTELRA